MSSNQSIQIQHLPQHPKSAKALNNGIPVFTSERAEERANTNSTTVKRSIQNVNQKSLDENFNFALRKKALQKQKLKFLK